MAKIDLGSFYRRIKPSPEYFKNPAYYWENIGYGFEEPKLLSQPLPANLRMPDAPESIRQEMLSRHPFSWGIDYYSAKLPNSNLLSLTVKKIPAHNSAVLRIPGLVANVADPKEHYVWQEGLTQAQAYYFYNQDTEALTSTADISRRITDKKVRFFFYSDEHSKRSARVYMLNERSEPYYAIFIANPNRLRDIIALGHELGHVGLHEKKPNLMQNLLNSGNYAEKIQWYEKEVEMLINSKGSPQEKQLAWEKLQFKLEMSEAYKVLMGAEMILEYQVWRETLPILEGAGLMRIFDQNQIDLLNYIFWAIKSRLPSISY